MILLKPAAVTTPVPTGTERAVAEESAGAPHRNSDPSGAESTRDEVDHERRRARIAAAKEAYRRTVRNESGQSAGGANDERLLADRPPHWAPKSR